MKKTYTCKGGPPPESCRWSSATAGHGHKPGGTRGFLRSAADARLRARGGRFRAAPQQPGIGCASFGRNEGGFGYRPGFFGPARRRRLPPRRRAGRGRQAGGRRATVATVSRRPWPCAASVERPGHDAPHDEAPRREGPFIGFGCRRAFLARRTAGVMGEGSAAVWLSPSEVAARPAHRTVERGFSESNAQRGGLFR